ncbi:MAG: AAA family ATPase, partial [Clostridia bacterium]|nr:AAA family ATPase [Clostridia bacterium]
MKIIECYVENFGKISKQKFSFKDGLNCINEDNGSGKTTLAAFIRVMLYGMSDTKKISLDENDRKHYLPWQGGVCGGSLTFSAGGKTYRVERTFAAKASDDNYTLYDTSTGRVSADFPEGLGEGLFGIDSDGFERTVFLSERALTPKSENKSISAKLSDLVGCDGDIGGMDEALKMLEEKRKFYYKKGGSGELADTKAKIDDIARRLDALTQVEASAENHHRQMQQIHQRIQKAREEAKEILRQREEALRRVADVNYEKQYKEMKLSLEESQRRRTAVSEIFGADIPSHSEIDAASLKSLEAKSLIEGTTESPRAVEFKHLSAKFDGKIDRTKIESVKGAVDAIQKASEKQADPRFVKAKRIFAKRVPTKEEIEGINQLLSTDKKGLPIGCLIAYILSAICCVAGILTEPMLIIIGAIGIAITLAVNIFLSLKAKADKRQKIDNFFLSVSGISVKDRAEAKIRLDDMSILLGVIGECDDSDTTALIKLIDGVVSLFPEYAGKDRLASAKSIIAEYDRYAEMAVEERFVMSDRTSKLERAEMLRREAMTFLARFRTKTDDPFGELRRALTEYDRLTSEIVAKRDEMARLESLYTMGESNQRKAEDELKLLDKKRQENEALVADLSREYTITEKTYTSECEELEGRDELAMR